MNIGRVRDVETLWPRRELADSQRLEDLPMTEEIRSQRVFLERRDLL